MKNFIIAILITLSLAATSCKKCVECVESHSGYIYNDCAVGNDAKEIQDDLNEKGSATHQSWTCVDK